MVFASSPSSVNSNFSFSDSVSDMSDDYTKPAKHEDEELEEELAFRIPTPPVFVEVGSLNSLKITVIVSIQASKTCLLYTLLYKTFFSTGR